MVLRQEHTSSQRLKGKVAVITGAAGGIGHATVQLFLHNGAHVIGVDLNEEAGAKLCNDIVSLGYTEEFHFIAGDVSCEAVFEQSVRAAIDSFGRLDVMFNNAGVGGAFGPLKDLDVRHWDETFAINMRSVFLGAKHAAKVMTEQKQGGVIMNTSSVAGLTGASGPLAYSAAKAAVINFTKNAAIELAADRIRVNAICPGVIFTPFMHGGREPEAKEEIKKIQPWPDHGDVEDIASVALFLASDESAFVTGEAMVVDGGYSAAGQLRGSPLAGHIQKPIKGMAYGTTGKAAIKVRIENDE